MERSFPFNIRASQIDIISQQTLERRWLIVEDGPMWRWHEFIVYFVYIRWQSIVKKKFETRSGIWANSPVDGGTTVMVVNSPVGTWVDRKWIREKNHWAADAECTKGIQLHLPNDNNKSNNWGWFNNTAMWTFVRPSLFWMSSWAPERCRRRMQLRWFPRAACISGVRPLIKKLKTTLGDKPWMSIASR